METMLKKIMPIAKKMLMLACLGLFVIYSYYIILTAGINLYSFIESLYSFFFKIYDLYLLGFKTNFLNWDLQSIKDIIPANYHFWKYPGMIWHEFIDLGYNPDFFMESSPEIDYALYEHGQIIARKRKNYFRWPFPKDPKRINPAVEEKIKAARQFKKEDLIQFLKMNPKLQESYLRVKRRKIWKLDIFRSMIKEELKAKNKKKTANKIFYFLSKRLGISPRRLNTLIKRRKSWAKNPIKGRFKFSTKFDRPIYDDLQILSTWNHFPLFRFYLTVKKRGKGIYPLYFFKKLRGIRRRHITTFYRAFYGFTWVDAYYSFYKPNFIFESLRSTVNKISAFTKILDIIIPFIPWFFKKTELLMAILVLFLMGFFNRFGSIFGTIRDYYQFVVYYRVRYIIIFAVFLAALASVGTWQHLCFLIIFTFCVLYYFTFTEWKSFSKLLEDPEYWKIFSKDVTFYYQSELIGLNYLIRKIWRFSFSILLWFRRFPSLREDIDIYVHNWTVFIYQIKTVYYYISIKLLLLLVEYIPYKNVSFFKLLADQPAVYNELTDISTPYYLRERDKGENPRWAAKQHTSVGFFAAARGLGSRGLGNGFPYVLAYEATDTVRWFSLDHLATYDVFSGGANYESTQYIPELDPADRTYFLSKILKGYGQLYNVDNIDHISGAVTVYTNTRSHLTAVGFPVRQFLSLKITNPIRSMYLTLKYYIGFKVFNIFLPKMPFRRTLKWFKEGVGIDPELKEGTEAYAISTLALYDLAGYNRLDTYSKDKLRRSYVDISAHESKNFYFDYKIKVYEPADYMYFSRAMHWAFFLTYLNLLLSMRFGFLTFILETKILFWYILLWLSTFLYEIPFLHRIADYFHSSVILRRTMYVDVDFTRVLPILRTAFPKLKMKWRRYEYTAWDGRMKRKGLRFYDTNYPASFKLDDYI